MVKINSSIIAVFLSFFLIPINLFSSMSHGQGSLNYNNDIYQNKLIELKDGEIIIRG